MKKYIYLLFSVLTLFTACTADTQSGQSEYEQEALGVVDSLRNVDTLSNYVLKYQAAGDKKAEIIIRETLGKLYRDQSDFANATAQHDSAISLSDAIGDTLNLIRALNQQGTNFRRIGDMDEASRLHYRALELCDQHKGDTSFVATKNRLVSLNGLGNVLLSMGNYTEAERIFRQALAGETRLHSRTGRAINFANLGSIFERNDQLDSARVYYNLSMQENIADNNATGIGLCYRYLGHLDEREGNITSAEQNYLTAYQTLLTTGDTWHWLEATTALARLYILENKADSALKYVNLTSTAAQQIDSREHRATAYALSSQIEERWGNTSRALTLYKLSRELNDSVLSDKNYNHIQNLRVHYEAKRRAAEINQARDELLFEQTLRRYTTTLFIIVLMALIGVLFVLLYINRVRKQSNRTLQSANEAMRIADEELRKADEELRQADRERQDFYRDIAHRFRTPLTVVIGMTQQLRSYISPDNKQAQGDFLAAERQTAELLRLVNEMMHRLQPNDTTATATSVEGNITFGNISDATTADENLVSAGKETQTLATANADGSKPLILLAEDNEDVARYQCELLAQNGYRVNWAADGVMALELIETEMPDLVITDIMMPRMDGLQLCRNIRSNPQTAHLPLIIVTARVEDRDRMQGLEAGAEVYLTKPFLGKELLLNIKNLLAQRHTLRQKYADTISPATSGTTGSTTATTDESIGENTTTAPAEESEFKKMVDEVIDTNLSNPDFSSTILAVQLCLSRAQLNRRVNAELQTDTSSYIRERRLCHACHMLHDPSYTIMDIQVACGFDSPAYFSRTFKQHYGKSPSEYRKNIQAARP